MASKPLEKLAGDDTEVIDALSDGDADGVDGLSDDTPTTASQNMMTMRLKMAALKRENKELRDMQIKMAALERAKKKLRAAVTSTPAAERSSTRLSQDNQAISEPRVIHRPLRTLKSPFPQVERPFASPRRTTTPGRLPQQCCWHGHDQRPSQLPKQCC